MAFQLNRGAVRRFARVMKFGAWLQNIPGKMTPAPFRLIQIGSAFWQSRVLHAAASLDIASALGDEALSVDAIAARVSADADALYRLLRMLAALGVFKECSPQVFRNNALSDGLRRDNPASVRDMILMHNCAAMSRPWYEQLEEGVRGAGVPFQRTHGSELLAYMDEHAEFDALFSAAMASVESLAGDGFATDFDWGRFDRLIDVGGSQGGKALAILKRWPGLTALVFDRRQVVESAPAYWAEKVPAELLGRMRWQAGDLFEEVPAAASAKDVYLLSAVLHGMDDRHACAVLRNLAGAVSHSGARVALLEMVVPEHQADLVTASFDMQMFMATRGKERRLSEWRRLFDQTGWALEEQVDLRSIGKILLLKTK